MRNIRKETAQRLYLSEQVQIKDILDDGITTITKSGALIHVISLAGKNFAGLTDEEQARLYKLRLNFFKHMEPELKVKVIYDRKKITAQKHDIDFKNIFVKELYEKHHSVLKESFTTKIYCVVTLEPKLNQQSHEIAIEELKKAHKELSVTTQQIISILKSYDAAYLKNTSKDPALLQFWSERINFGNSAVVPNHAQSLFQTLALTDISFDEDQGVVELSDGEFTEYGAILRINTLPETTSQEMMNVLSQARHNFLVVQNIQLYDDEKYATKLTKDINSMNSLVNSAFGNFIGGRHIFGPHYEEYGECVENIRAGNTRFLKHQFMVIVRAFSKEALDKAVQDIQNLMAVSYIHARKETKNLENAFWSQYPTMEEMNEARSNDISIHDAANFISLSTASEGFYRCAFGDRPVMTFVTPEETAYNFTFHDTEEPEAPGSTAVIAPTGGGKSTLIMDLIAHCLPYGGNEAYGSEFKALLFDNEFGLKSQVACLDGQHIDLGSPHNLPMNPFHLDQTPDNLQFIIHWVTTLGAEKGDLSPKELNAIESWVYEIMKLDKKDRTFAAASEIIDSLEYEPGQVTLKDRFSKWMPDFEDPRKSPIYSMYFNAQKDALSFEKQIVCFEMGNMLKNNPDMVAPVFSYIYHSFMQSIKNEPGPHIVFIDELKGYLQNPVAAEFIEGMILKIRKLGGIVVMAAQDPGHILDCVHGDKDFGRSISQNLSTKMFFPNSDADIELYKEFGLNENEVKWLQENEGRRQIMIKKRGMQSIIVDIDFSYYGEHLHLISGNPKDTKTLEALTKDIPDYEKRIRTFMKMKQKRFDGRK